MIVLPPRLGPADRTGWTSSSISIGGATDGVGSLKPPGLGLGLGLDLEIAKNTGLYLRHQWYDFKDKNFELDHYRGQEKTLELKAFF